MRILVVGMGHFAAPGVEPAARVRSGGETKLVEALRRWQDSPRVEIDVLGADLTRRYYAADGITRVRYLALDPALDDAELPPEMLAAFRAAAARRAPLDARYDGVFSASDGKKLSETKLPRAVAFDGMIAARGRLYAVTKDGHLLCME